MASKHQERLPALSDLPVIRALPWHHRGRGVIVDCQKRVLGAFERPGDAQAVVALVNELLWKEPR